MGTPRLCRLKYGQNEIRFTTEVMLLTDFTDEQLLGQALAGDEEAFTALYRRRQGPIFRFALHMSGSTQIAEEVTQDVFMFLLQRGHDFDPQRGALGAYLFGVARNYVRRALERNYPESVLSSPIEDEAASLMVIHDPSEGMARHQTSTAVWKAVLSLPEHYREVVVLCDLQEHELCGCRGSGAVARSAQSGRGCIGRTTCSARSCNIRRRWLRGSQVLRRGAYHDMP